MGRFPSRDYRPFADDGCLKGFWRKNSRALEDLHKTSCIGCDLKLESRESSFLSNPAGYEKVRGRRTETITAVETKFAAYGFPEGPFRRSTDPLPMTDVTKEFYIKNFRTSAYEQETGRNSCSRW